MTAFDVRQRLAGRIGCRAEDLQIDGRPAVPDWSSREQREYTLHGEYAGRIIVSAPRRHGSDFTRQYAREGHRQVTVSWTSGSETFRIPGEVPVSW